MNIYGFIKHMREERPDQTVFSYLEDGIRREISVRQWTDEVFAFAAYLNEYLGPDKKNNIGVAVRSCYDWYVAVPGIILSGNTAVAFNPDLAEEDLLYQIHAADVKELYWDPEEENTVVSSDTGIRQHSLAGAVRSSREIVKTERSFEDGTPDEEAPCLILFSSGTSGLPKGVMLSQKNILAAFDDLEGRIDRGRGMLMIPPYHVAWIDFTFCFIRYPITLCICESPKYLARDMKVFRPTVMVMVPSQLEYIVSRCRKDAELRRAVSEELEYIVCVGAFLENEYQTLLSEWKVQLLNLYGLTETGGSLTDLFPHKSGSVGKFSTANRMKIVDGELAVKGDSVTPGYYGNPEETEKVLRDGWLYTGDLIRVDEDGFLYLTGRKKNVIILPNGENVSPEALELKLRRISQIREVIVMGQNGVLEAEIYLGEMDSADTRELVKQEIDRLTRELPRYHQLRRIIFRDEPFPHTGSGKIKRNV